MEQDTAAGRKNIEDRQRPQLQLCHAVQGGGIPDQNCHECSHTLTTVTGRAPDAPARRGKLTTVTGRVLPALQLHSEGDSTIYFLHKNTSPLSHSGHSEGNSLVAGQFFVPFASSQAEYFKPSNSLVAGNFFVLCNSVILG